jgi:hypothetical protein
VARYGLRKARMRYSPVAWERAKSYRRDPESGTRRDLIDLRVDILGLNPRSDL